MRNTIRNVATAYLLLGIWAGTYLAVLVAAVPLLEGPDPLLSANPILDATGFSVVALLAATMVTVGIAWTWRHLRSRPSRSRSQEATQPRRSATSIAA